MAISIKYHTRLEEKQLFQKTITLELFQRTVLASVHTSMTSFQQTFAQTEFAFDQKDASYPPQMDYMVLEHSSSEPENCVTADKMVGSGCIAQNKGIRTIRNGKRSLQHKLQSGQKS